MESNPTLYGGPDPHEFTFVNKIKQFHFKITKIMIYLDYTILMTATCGRIWHSDFSIRSLQRFLFVFSSPKHDALCPLNFLEALRYFVKNKSTTTVAFNLTEEIFIQINASIKRVAQGLIVRMQNWPLCSSRRLGYNSIPIATSTLMPLLRLDHVTMAISTREYTQQHKPVVRAPVF